MQPLIVYSASWCSDCQALRTWMDDHHVNYEIRDIQSDRVHRDTLRNGIGKEAVPHLLVKGQWIRGYQVGKDFDPAWCRDLFTSLKIPFSSPKVSV